MTTFTKWLYTGNLTTDEDISPQEIRYFGAKLAAPNFQNDALRAYFQGPLTTPAVTMSVWS